MKQTNFIGYENVVNIENLEKIFIFGVYTYVNYGNILLTTTDKKHRFNSKINKVVNHSSFFSKKFEVIPKEISIRINN